MNLILIGYRATGKTTLARLLAAKLGWSWVDLDEEIEREAGKPIARIFAEDGEPAFRDLESKTVREWCGRDFVVIATGGGAPLREDNRRAMKASGVVIWLTANPQTIHARMQGDATTAARRPALTAAGGLDEIIRLLAQREPIYRQTADLIIDTENRSPESLAEEILSRIELGQERN
ncbi:MAG: shikimate kinase [Thermogutta sp.]